VAGGDVAGGDVAGGDVVGGAVAGAVVGAAEPDVSAAGEDSPHAARATRAAAPDTKARGRER
jgi:hypothetical protein